MSEPRPSGDVAKADLYRELGYGGDPAAYEAALEEVGLSKPRKGRIAATKKAQVAAVLAARFIRVCGRGDCSARAGGMAAGRRVAPASSQAWCEVCGGSVNRATVDRMVEACAAAGWSRLVVVGGSPTTRDELERLVAGRLTLRFVEGTVAQTLKQAEANLAWADRVVVWGSTQLDHKVSGMYRGGKVTSVHRRGIADLAKEVVESAGRTAGRRAVE